MLVAVHSDTWLYAVAFYNGARLDKGGRYTTTQVREIAEHAWNTLFHVCLRPCRERLFELINDLPTCYEIVSGKGSAASKAQSRKRPPASMMTSGRPGQPKVSARQVSHAAPGKTLLCAQ